MDNEKINLIVEHILTNEENLLLTSQVVRAFDEAIEKLVVDFLHQLENELIYILGPEWIVENELEENVFGKNSFSISKKNWEGLYFIGFYPEKTRLRDFDLYVWRDTEVISSPNNVVKKLLDENYKKGNAYKRGDWWQYVDGYYRNWTSEETLIKLYEKNEMVHYFKEQFIKIKSIIEPIIDKEIKKYI